MDVKFYEVFEEEEESLRRYLPPSVQAQYTSKTIQDSGETKLPAPVISLRTQSVIPTDWAKQLAGVLSRSTGYDHLLAYQKKTGCSISLGYLPVYCARSVAEHTMMTMFSLLRGLKKQLHQFKSFQRDGLTGSECLGKRLLVLGVGNIGKEVVDLGRGLGMQVKGVDLVKRLSDLDYVSLEDGIFFADVIICALPLTELTQGMLNCESLRDINPGTLFINIGRGEVAPVRDLKQLLDQGFLGGIGLDIYENESELAECLRSGSGDLNESGQTVHILKDRQNVICTPHNAFNTREALERKSRQSAESIVHFSRHRSFLFPVPIEK